VAGPDRALRLFLALEFEQGARSELGAWAARALAARDDLRPVAPDALHVTLVFLGATAPERVPSIWAATEAGATGQRAAKLSPIGVKGAPRRRPRLFALDLADEDGRAAKLRAEVAGALASGGLHARDPHPFWAHVTLARVRRGRRPRPLAIEPPAPEPLCAPALALYRSDPSPEGSRYTALEGLELHG